MPGRISFTVDTWTSPNTHSFLGINAHWINQDWQLTSILIDFIKLSGSHSRENLAKAFIDCIQDFGIQTKVCNYVDLFKIIIFENQTPPLIFY